MSDGFQNVHIRVNDAATGKPTPVRISFQSADGRFHAPFGRVDNFATTEGTDVGGHLLLGQQKFYYIDGTCEIRLPVGNIRVEIHKGPEFIPVVENVRLTRGKLAFRFVIERWLNTKDRGYYSGDTHSFYLSPHAALLEAAAEDLFVVNLLVKPIQAFARNGEGFESLPNILAFSGQQPALSSAGHIVAVNTFNQHPYLGSLALLHCHRAVYPLTFGPPHGPDDWNLADWCEQCHRKRGLVVATHFLQDLGCEKGEVLADAVLSLIDAIDIGHLAHCSTSALAPWFELLQCGLRIPLTGGSGKCSNLEILGRTRTYVHMDTARPSLVDWIEGVRSGRTMVSNGPFLELQVNGTGPGSVVQLRDKSVKPRIVLSAQSLADVRVELIEAGQVVREVPTSKTDGRFCAFEEFDLAVERGTWILARCYGTSSSDREWAITSPVYVQVGDTPLQPDVHVVQKIVHRLENMLTWLREHGRFDNERQFERMAAIYRDAIDRLQRSQV